MEDYNGISRRKKVIPPSPQKLPECAKILTEMGLFKREN
jgi:hypothetical protein